MTGIVLLIIGSFIFGALVGFFSAILAIANAIANNTRGIRDLVEAQIAKSKKLDNFERTLEKILKETENK